MANPQDYFFMLQALLEADKARFISDPNPRVGCVIVQHHQIIGTGFTQEFGSHHAEVMAIRDAQARGHDTTGATVYVTLEPCCHFGKTPPCVDALFAAGVSKVVVGATDPNPFVMGQGIEQLKAHQIEVHTGLLAEQSIAQNPGFMKRMQTGMPWVRLKIASSQDGITALNNGQSQWITSEAARLDGHRWRAQASVVLTGIGTVLADDPQLNVRGLAVTRQPLKAIIDSKLEISPSAKILATGQAIIFCASADTEKMDRLFAVHPHLKIIPLPNEFGKVDLAATLQYLADQFQANEVHVESGFKLNGSFLREGCVDEILHYQAPCLLGSGIGLANLNPIEQLADASRWQVLERANIGNDQRIRLVRPNPIHH